MRRTMQRWDKTIVPVRPAVDQVLGEPAYPTLAAVAGRIDLVNAFRQAAEADAVLDAAIAVGAPAIWQSGIRVPQTVARARAAGLIAVMDRCLMVESPRLMAE
jgi:predicted CoA-binding protein